MSDALQKAKEEVLWGCRLMVERGYLLGTVGNLSARSGCYHTDKSAI